MRVRDHRVRGGDGVAARTGETLKQLARRRQVDDAQSQGIQVAIRAGQHHQNIAVGRSAGGFGTGAWRQVGDGQRVIAVGGQMRGAAHVPGNRHAAGNARNCCAAGNRPIRRHGQIETVARRNLDDVTQSRRQRNRAEIIGAPGDHVAVLLERETVVGPGRDGHHIAQAGGDIHLSIIITAPSHHGPVVLERQTVIRPGRDGDHVAQACGRSHLTQVLTVRAKPNHRAVVLQRQRVIRAASKV